jgi:hypothetical protein
MKLAPTIAAIGALAAAGLGVAASALDGTFVAPSGTKATFTETAAHIELPDGTAFDVPAMTEGNMIVFYPEADDPTCPGQNATYTVSETVEGVTFAAQSDDCEARKADLTAGPWKRAE